MLKEKVLAPLIAGALVVSVLAVAWSARSHRKIGPLMLILVGAAAIAWGRLVGSIAVLVYSGSAVLLATSLWNLWLKRRRRAPT